MADDIVKVRYDVQLAELQGALKQTLDPLNKIDETVKQTSKDMTEGAKKASKEYGNLASAAKKVANETQKAGKVTNLKKLNTEIKKTGDKAVNTANQVENLSNKTKDLTKNNGLANNTAIEFGRTLSDAPYGIRGVANNIQQLGSNFAQLRTQTGSASLAFKALLGSFAGPLGFLVLFQGAIALVDYFWGSTKKVTEEVKENTKATTAQSIATREQTSRREKQNEALKETEERISNVNNLTRQEINLQIAQAQSRISSNQKILESFEKNIIGLEDVTEGQMSYNDAVDDGSESLDIESASIDDLISAQGRGTSKYVDGVKARAEAIAEYGSLYSEVANDEKFIEAARAALQDTSTKNTKTNTTKRIAEIKREFKSISDGVDAVSNLSDGNLLALNLLFDPNDLAVNNKRVLRDSKETLDKLLDFQRKYTEGLNNEQIKRNRQDEEALLQQVQIQQQFASAIGQNFDLFFSEQEDRGEAFLKATLTTLLQYLRSYMITQIAQATIGSLASPQSVASGGTIGVTQAAVLTGLIEAAFQIAKAGIQNFHDGSEFVTGERGRDKIPAMIEYGERVVPTSTNNLLGGIPNNELPKAVEYYNKMKGKGFAESLSGSLSLNAALNDKGIIGASGSVENQIKGLRKDLRRNRNFRNGF